MTSITSTSNRYRTMFTQNVNEISLKLGFDIGDKDFDIDVTGFNVVTGNARGYVHIPLHGTAMTMYGPITLHKSDLCKLVDGKWELIK